jgi:hypothetical protein
LFRGSSGQSASKPVNGWMIVTSPTMPTVGNGQR